MKLLKNIELEWKILTIASFLFLAFIWPVQDLVISKLIKTLEQSFDPMLETTLRSQLPNCSPADSVAIISSITRTKQWEALIPILVKEQQIAFVVFSSFLFLLIFIFAIWILKGLTKPLKNLALAVDKIGEGKFADVKNDSGGALGKVEVSIITLQSELTALREKFRIQGMEMAWQDIARIMAHEIKNPLTPIRLTLDRIEERIVLEKDISPKELMKFLGRVNGQVDMLERLVNQFRSFSKDPEVTITSVALTEPINKTSEDLASKIKTDIIGNEKVNADPYLLNQVFLNIWKNSLEAGATKIRVTIESDDKFAKLNIADNGDGISQDDIDRIWLPYVTLKKGGTGLGLPVVKRLIETMNGTVEIFSGEENGLVVSITLPLAL